MKMALTTEWPVTADISVPNEVLADFELFAQQITASSGIIWGEHCSECAVPACYSACSFYSPRPDLTCRRFVAGIELVKRADPLRLRRIRFRKWGKLEGMGPAPVHPTSSLHIAEFANFIASTLLLSTPQSFRLKRYLVWRLNQQRERRAKRPVGLNAQAFVIESWSADGQTHPFTVTFLERPGNRIYQESFEIRPHYNRLVIPLEHIVPHLGLDLPYLVQIEPSAECPACDVVFGVADFVSTRPELRIISPSTRNAPTKGQNKRRAKIIVWDLDNTLWDGTLAEDGFEGISLRPDVAAVIVELDKRGILHSIASKNDEQQAQAALKAFGLAHYFLHPQINWNPKSDSIQRIARSVDFGLDSFIFVDDQPFERGEVSDRVPQITVIPDTMVKELTTHELCDVPVTPESRSRRVLYQEEARRAIAFEATDTDYLDFLRLCNIRLEISALDPTNFERIYELSQRTNQLNFCGTKYTREELKKLMISQADLTTFVLRCTDKFGAYGIIGFAVVDFTAGFMRDFFMSCRVQRKCVENAFFSMLATDFRARGKPLLSIRFRQTDRNGAAIEMLKGLGFKCSDTLSKSEWLRSVESDFDNFDIVAISQTPARTKSFNSKYQLLERTETPWDV
jgi:FkbH-like protein